MEDYGGKNAINEEIVGHIEIQDGRSTLMYYYVVFSSVVISKR